MIHEKLPFEDSPEDYKIINNYWLRFDLDKKGGLFLKDVEIGLLSDLGLPKLPNTWATIGTAFDACQRDIHGSAIKS